MVCFFLSFKYGTKFCLLNWLRSYLILVTIKIFIVLGSFFSQLQVVVFVSIAGVNISIVSILSIV